MNWLRWVCAIDFSISLVCAIGVFGLGGDSDMSNMTDTG